MVRSRIRTTNRAKWTEDTLKKAIEAVNNGNSVKKVSKDFNIPRSTLRDRLKSQNGAKPSLGRKPIFSEEQEQQLSDHVVTLAKIFYGITPTDLRRLAFDVAEKIGLKHNFNQDSKMAGLDWLRGFIKRHKISLRAPEATSLNRATAFNKEEVTSFYDNLDTVMSKHKFPPNRIYNMDETGISTVQKPGKILAPQGQKQVGGMTSWERGKNITVICAISASGNYIPPMFIYPRKRMTPLLERDGPAGAIYKCSHNGWSNEELFFEWLAHFQKHVKSSRDDPVLLVLDNHGSHITLQTYEFCRTNHICMVSIPPHTSHRLQPLDVTFYSSLKNAFNKECDYYMKTHFYQKVTPYDIAAIFNKAYIKTATIEKAVAGFNSSGIHPFQPNKFTDDDFAPSQTVMQQLVIEDKELEDVRPTPAVEPNDVVPEAINPDQTCKPIDPQPLVSSDGAKNFKSQLLEISPLPSTSGMQPKHKQNKKQHSMIITATPVKSLLDQSKLKKEEKEKKKEEAKKRKIEKQLEREKKTKKINKGRPIKKSSKAPKKKTCRRRIHFEESSSEEEVDDKDLYDDNEDDDLVDLFSADTEMCIICGEYGSNELWYRCVICGKWAHSECSGNDSPENYTCDYCIMD